MRQGEIWLVRYPYTDGTSAKLRPVLVVLRDAFNNRGDVVVVPLSSQVDRNATYAVVVDPALSEYSSTGLRCESAIKWANPLIISKQQLERKLGALPAETLDIVCRKVASVFIASPE